MTASGAERKLGWRSAASGFAPRRPFGFSDSEEWIAMSGIAESARSNIRWGCSVEPLEGAVEIGEVAEAGREGDRCDISVRPSRICQKSMRSH
jgi:hypothetical protein